MGGHTHRENNDVSHMEQCCLADGRKSGRSIHERRTAKLENYKGKKLGDPQRPILGLYRRINSPR